MKNVKKISSAELEIMEVLWKTDNPICIQEVLDSIKEDKWKYNTVGTMLARLAKKGFVTEQKVSRVMYYSAALKREDYKREQTAKLISRLYGGSARELAAMLVESGQMTREDLDEIEKMFEL